QSPPCTDASDVAHRGQFIGYSTRSDVPTHERQVGQKKNRRPTEIAEWRRWFVVIRAPIEPRNDRPNAEQQCDQQQTNLRTSKTKEMGRKFLQQLILPQEIPFRFDARVRRRERICLLT